MYIFPTKDEINKTHFFRFERDIIRNGIWANLPTASKAIFPVIGVHANANGKAWPGQMTISRMAGISPKTVRSGIKGFRNCSKIKLSTKTSKYGRRAYEYQISLPPVGKRKDFRFYRSLVESGFWATLTPGEQAVYPTLRAYAYFEPMSYFEYCDELNLTVPEDVDYGNFLEEGHYEDRWFDMATPELDVVSEAAGVCMSTVRSAIEKLREKGMVYVFNDSRYNSYFDEDEDIETYCVFIRPRYFIKEDERVISYAEQHNMNKNYL